jgi:hypothetical protein
MSGWILRGLCAATLDDWLAGIATVAVIGILFGFVPR